MPAAEPALPLSDAEAAALLAPLSKFSRVLIALSGGPDSTALLLCAARWAAGFAGAPALVAATVDHGLRAGSAQEARCVGERCTALGVPHHVLTWTGAKPATGIQEAARAARYDLLTACAIASGAQAIAVAHTLDDQAETVLFRLARGSGLSGLGGMRAVTRRNGIALVRPLLAVPKTRLVATVAAAGVPYVEDPSNADFRFARARLRALGATLAGEGLDPARLATLARRMARANAALEHAVDAAAADLAPGLWTRQEAVTFARDGFARLPEEVAIRLVGRAVAVFGSEGEAELGKLEALVCAFRMALTKGQMRLRRTLSGAMVTLNGSLLTVSRAPERRAARPMVINSEKSPAAVLGKEGPDT